ncbi:MAG TPA: hypothetical protein VIC26_15550 [Marinagarivorans sp.]
MKAIKITAAIVALVVLLVVGAVLAVLFNLERLVVDAVETRGPEVTSTPVNLGGVDIQLLRGVAQLKNFEVANPKGFTSEHAFKADTLRVKVDPNSLRSGIIVLDEIIIDGIAIVAEQKGFTTNIQQLHQAVKKFVNEKAPQSSEADQPVADAGPEPRFIVKKLSFANNSMRLITEDYGSYTLDIPAVQRANLDGGGQGLTANEMAVAILEPILNDAEKAAKNKLKKVAKSEVEDKVKAKLEENLDEDSKAAVDKLKGLLGR